jgi:hypothetical protein
MGKQEDEDRLQKLRKRYSPPTEIPTTLYDRLDFLTNISRRLEKATSSPEDLEIITKVKKLSRALYSTRLWGAEKEDFQ